MATQTHLLRHTGSTIQWRPVSNKSSLDTYMSKVDGQPKWRLSTDIRYILSKMDDDTVKWVETTLPISSGIILYLNSDNFIIPTTGTVNSLAYGTYDWNVSIDGGLNYTRYTGIGSNAGIPLTSISVDPIIGLYKVIIKPYVEADGWALHFGWYKTELTDGSLVQTNRDKLVRCDFQNNPSYSTILPSGLTSCNAYMANCFRHCRSLTTVNNIPPLPPSFNYSVSNYLNSCFFGCTSLTTTPDIPPLPDFRTDRVNYLQGTFYGCSSLVTVINLPAMTQAANADSYLNNCFRNCTSLTTVSIPPLPYNCINPYSYLFSCFNGCTSLTTTPYIPPIPERVGNTTNVGSYLASCFDNCTSLTTVTNIPAITVRISSATGYLGGTFENCTSLTTVPPIPALPGTPESNSNLEAYLRLTFNGCTSLTDALIPNVPAITAACRDAITTWGTTTGPTYNYAGNLCPASPDTPLTTANATAGYQYHT